MMEYRKNAVMECWSNGVMRKMQCENSVIWSEYPILHHSNTPVLQLSKVHHSNTPI
jgi:hypothetical protein